MQLCSSDTEKGRRHADSEENVAGVLTGKGQGGRGNGSTTKCVRQSDGSVTGTGWKIHREADQEVGTCVQGRSGDGEGVR